MGTRRELEEHPHSRDERDWGGGGGFFSEPLRSLRHTFPIEPLPASTAAARLCPSPTVATWSTKQAPSGATTLTFLLQTEGKKPSQNHTHMGAPEQVG